MQHREAAAGKVVVHRTMSLDGYIAGPDDAMDWVFEYETPAMAWEVMEATGAILAGRGSYEVGRRDAGKGSGEAYGGAWSGPEFVLTHRPPVSPSESSVTFLSGDIEEAVATALEAAGGRNLEVLGADLTGQCLERGLVDEIVVHVVPVLLGSGTPFATYAHPGRFDLELVDSASSAGVTSLRFAVRRKGAK